MKYDDMEDSVLKEIKGLLNTRLWAVQQERFGWNSLDGPFKYEGYGDSLNDAELNEINSKIREINNIMNNRKYG